MAKLNEVQRTLAYHLTEPVVKLLANTPITPTTLTWFGFLLNIGAAVLIIIQQLLAAGFVVLLAGFFDILDGALARRTKQVTNFGAVLDSTLDRLSEAVLLFGILFLYAEEPSLTGILLVIATLTGSFLVSYIRARAEALGLECTVGLFTRAERIIVLALGLLLNQITIILAIIAVLAFFTAGQRLFHAWQQTRVK